MRKVMTFILAVAMLLCLAGCGSAGQSSKPAEESTAAPATAEPAPGPTEAPTPEPTAEPVPQWEVVSSGVDTWTDVVNRLQLRAWIEIENTGSEPLYLSSASFDIEDADGKLLDTMKLVSGYPQVLLPGERGVYEDYATAADGTPAEGLKVVSRLPVELARVDCLRLDVADYEVRLDSYKQTKGMGRIVNGLAEPQKFIYVASLLYNADGEYIGLLHTVVNEEIPAGERQGFETMAARFPLDPDSVASSVEYAYPNQYQF